MEFKGWLLLNENIELNFDSWLKSIQNYAKPHEQEMLKAIGIYEPSDSKYPNRGDIVHEFNGRLKNWQGIITKVLKRKNAENLNWLAFSIGYLIVKSFAEEDLELAIDVTKSRIESRDLPKAEIGRKGWMQIGKEALEHVRNYLADQQQLSNRQKLKLKKSGDTIEEDKDLIKLVAKENKLEIYYLPSLNLHPNSVEDAYDLITKGKLESRKRILCKYGKDTDWCTANPTGDYDRYYINNDIYILYKNEKPRYQFTSCKDGPKAGAGGLQFMDTKDNPVKDISLDEKEFLDKYVKEAYGCYPLRIIFPSLESYISSEPEIKKRVSLTNIEYIVDDPAFKNISSDDAALIFDNINASDLPATMWIKIIDNIPEKVLNDSYVIRDKNLLDMIIQIQHYGYDGLVKKLSRERFDDLLDTYRNDLYDYDKDDPSYKAEVVNSRKRTIRKLLEKGFSLKNTMKILDFITKKADIKPSDAYTIFDVIIGLTLEAVGVGGITRSGGGLHGSETTNLLDDFAKAFGKENINKIDLDRLQSRMNVGLISDGGKYKIKPEPGMTLGPNSLKKLMVYFLIKYHDKVSAT